MKYKINPNYFIIGWLLLNLLQAALGELTSDEGYYWFYSHHLDWGYYDHPPFLALMVKAGYYFFKNEFGVRLFNVLLTGLGLFIILKMLPEALSKKALVYILILSLPLLTYLSFIIFPDGPLLFFSAVYLWSYKKFIEKPNAPNALIIALVVALMLYSKYHGILIVVFTVLSNFNLLKNKYFYVSMVTALVLFVPHILWQYQHNFITLNYHLKQRTDSFSYGHILEYISQQLLAIGPGFIIIPFVYKAKGQFEKTLLYIITGTFLFFLVAALKGQVYFHWTSLIIFPLIILAANYYDDIRRQKLFYRLMLPFLFLIILVRMQLMFPIFPLNHVGIDYYHGRKKWAMQIDSVAGHSPVLFSNKFREAALYSFYSGRLGVALFSGDNRKSQYELWNYEDSLQNKDVLYVNKFPLKTSTPLINDLNQTLYYDKIKLFHSFYNIRVSTAFPAIMNKLNNPAIILTIFNPRRQTLYFKANNSEDGVALISTIKKEDKLIKQQTLKIFSPSDSLNSNAVLQIKSIILTNDLAPGKYSISFGFKTSMIEDSYNAIYNFEVR